MNTTEPAIANEGQDESGARELGTTYARHHAALVRYLTRLTRCASRAEDLAQATWLKLLAHRARTAWCAPNDSEMRAYLFAAARNLFLDEYTRKHENTRTRSFAPDALDAAVGPAGPQDGPEQRAVQYELATRVRAAVATLPAEQRAVVVMWVQGVSLQDMAARARAPVDTVLSRKKYAFARMRRTLAPHVESVAAG
jgi:RNA polymerase sigma factor (sigma-70 family)